jgi:hypothetical protein
VHETPRSIPTALGVSPSVSTIVWESSWCNRIVTPPLVSPDSGLKSSPASSTLSIDISDLTNAW